MCDDAFLRRRLSKYPNIEKYRKGESLKKFYRKVVFLIFEMKNIYEFDYTGGDFETQHRLLKLFKDEKLMTQASIYGELKILKFAINKYSYMLPCMNHCLCNSSQNGHLEVVKYLVKEKRADVQTNFNYPLITASSNGHIDVVKFLLNSGADIQAMDNMAVRYAACRGHFEIVKYLVEKGANIHDFGDYALKYARENGYSHIVKYIESI